MSNRYPGHGAELHVELTPGSFAKIPGMQSITGPEMTTPERDNTALDDTAMSYATNLPDGGSMSFTIYYDPGDVTHLALHDIQEDGEVVGWRKVYPSGHSIEFEGRITSYPSPDCEVNANLVTTLAVRVSGVISKPTI